MTDNQNCFAEYVQTGSDIAFRELVTHYVGLVYSTALRLVGGDAHQAQDVAQSVFINLACVARTLPQDVKLGGWLHRDTCFTAATLMRGERRRQSRERQAAEMNALQIASNADYSLIAPLLDEAINELGDEDRTAILLRFFEQHDFRSVGQALNSNEDAARMRVTRALEKLEAFLKRRGITTTAASLGGTLSANAVQAAPVGLALTISTAAALTGTTLATTATITTATKAIAMTALQKTIFTATIAVLAGAGIYEARQASQLRGQVQTLQQQQAPLTKQIQQLQTDGENSARELARLVADNERLNRSTGDLLKLRGEVARLRRDSQELALLKAGRAQPPIASGNAEMNAVLARVGELKQMLSQKPDLSIPELQFLTSQDWLNVAAGAKLDTDSGARIALSRLRSAAKMAFAPMLVKALTGYVQASDGQLPTAILQLKPHFSPPVEDALLNRYQLLATGKVSDLPAPESSSFVESPGRAGTIRVKPPSRPRDSVISEQAKVDGEFDSVLSVGLHGSHLSEEGPIGSGLDAVTRSTILGRTNIRTHN